MELEEVLAFSNQPNEIVLFKQALFCKSYETSAWQFCLLIRSYKPVKQYIKKVKKEIVSIGFPVSILENIKNIAKEKGYEIKQSDSEDIIRISTTGGCEGSFEAWKNSIKTTVPVQNNRNPVSTNLFDKRKEAVIEK
ncbi:MAG: hypothetical protein V4549_20075 [Bacteroidota bacterium]